jgi:hypothetical protein
MNFVSNNYPKNNSGVEIAKSYISLIPDKIQSVAAYRLVADILLYIYVYIYIHAFIYAK